MDKTNSFRCVKCALIAANAVIIILGLVGFIIGLVKPNNLQSPTTYGYYGISGSQLALVSCIAVVIATAGLIGALREHFYLLLVYALCILAVFIFRVTWWATAPLHLSERFLMDIGVSVTLLTSLVMLFLFIFAVLEALTIQNSLPLTKQKFLQLKTKLKSKTTPSKKKKKKTIKLPPKPKGKLSHHDANNIYTTSSSIYGSSGRRRSPSRTNGHHHSTSSRAKKYHPGNGIEYSSSPDTSHASNDSNNNHHSSQNPVNHPQQQSQHQQHNTSINTKSSHRSSSPLVTGDSVDYSRNPKNYSSNHYYHFQSPTPSTPTPSSPTPIPESNYSSKHQLGLNQHVHRPTPPAGQIPARTNQAYNSKVNSLPRTATTTTSSNSTRNSSTIARSSGHHPPTSVTTTQSGSPMTRAFANFLRPNFQQSSASPTPSGPLPNHGQANLIGKSSKPVSPTPPLLPTSRPKALISPINPISRPSTLGTGTTTTSNYQSDRPIFVTTTAPSSFSSNLFNYSSLSSFGVPKTSTRSNAVSASVTTPSSNLNQTRSLFSNYISPLSGTESRAKSPPPTTTTTITPTSSIISGSLFERNATQSSSSLNKWPQPGSTQGMSSRVSTTPMYYSSSKLSSSVPPVSHSTSSSSASYLQLNMPSSVSSSMSSSVESPLGASTRYQPSLFSSPPPSYSISTSKMSTIGITPSSLTSPTSVSASGDMASTPSTSKSSIMARLYPKSYEDYIKSYRYPSENSTIRPSVLSSSSPIVSVQKNDLSSTSSTTTNNNSRSIVSMDHGQAEISNTTIMSTTTQHRQLTEHQNQSIYFREIIRES